MKLAFTQVYHRKEKSIKQNLNDEQDQQEVNKISIKSCTYTSHK